VPAAELIQISARSSPDELAPAVLTVLEEAGDAGLETRTSDSPLANAICEKFDVTRIGPEKRGTRLKSFQPDYNIEFSVTYLVNLGCVRKDNHLRFITSQGRELLKMPLDDIHNLVKAIKARRNRNRKTEIRNGLTSEDLDDPADHDAKVSRFREKVRQIGSAASVSNLDTRQDSARPSPDGAGEGSPAVVASHGHAAPLTGDQKRRQALTMPGQGASGGGPGYWWGVKAGENVWMEITRRDDIGTDLKAPSAARGGAATASYALVPLVRPGDVVIHYDSHREAIVGASEAAGAAEPAPIYWAARGSYARRAGEQPRWLPGLRVPLRQYRELEPPVTLAAIREHKDALMALRQKIQDSAGGQPVYFPWIPYQDTLRTFQSYLVKMPQEAVSLFPVLRELVRHSARSPEAAPASPVQEAEQAIRDAAGKAAARGRGQGFQLDQEVKVAVEACAMNAATEYYRKEWDVQDVHGIESYDLICRSGSHVKHVEVKGTTTDGSEIILTPNEVRHARENSHTALFILSHITAGRAEDGTVTVTGGQRHVYDPWRLDDGSLKPLGFRYRIPGL
jgi:hypothetical protein